ncbi:transporter [Rhodospirillaceae bacterium SYSU D60014]|uniref:transporter n=1 Tax=Virgifigura deserti TaxID=2268457 RepID=UPI000E66509C
MPVRFVFLSLSVAVALLAASGCPQDSAAGDVADVVTDLYSGDGITLAPTPPPFPSHAPHFTASSLGGLNELNQAVTANAGLFPFSSVVAGFTFNVELGVPVRTTESLGPLIAERASTLGEGNLYLGVSYSRIDYQRFEGDSLNDLSLIFSHEDVNQDGVLGPAGTPLAFELDQVRVDLDLEIEQDLLALYATYGVTERWDVGAIVPIIHSSARAEAHGTVVRNSPNSAEIHNFNPELGGDPADSTIDRDATGLGDVILRTKYNFLRDERPWPDLAAVGLVKLPTGDEDDLLGTGETDVLGMLVASRAFGAVMPHLNLGYEISTDSEQSNLLYIVGGDWALSPRLTLAGDIFGRWEPSGDDIGDHLVDLAFGAKWNAYGDLVLSGNILVPLNPDEGLRTDFIWTLGAEMPF